MIFSSRQIEILNTPIAKNINYWTLLHVIYGILWGFTNLPINQFIVIHLILEFLEIYSFGHLDSSTYEFMDIFIDMVGGIIGVLITKHFKSLSYLILLWFGGIIFSKDLQEDGKSI